ncbi:MAG: Formation of crista junctions protein 1 [Piccolia ochrophora]|nr:MAG: Formation of crista junctions protein 1 [Piccolia ochrophora]
MLRKAFSATSAREARSIGLSINPRWPRTQLARLPPQRSTQRFLADLKGSGINTKASISDPTPAALPGSASKSTKTASLINKATSLGSEPSSQSPATPTSSSAIPAENVPRTPPPPPGGKSQTAPPTSIPPSSKPPTEPSASPSPPPPPKRRRFRTFILSLLILGTLGYGGGVYYSMVNDNFHDFFTEYVPLGEEAVLYLEEREFRKKFPHNRHPAQTTPRTPSHPRESGNRVTIPSNSGMSVKIAEGNKKDGSKSTSKDPAKSAAKSEQKSVTSSDKALVNPEDATRSDRATAVEQVKKKPTPSSQKSTSTAQNSKDPPQTTQSTKPSQEKHNEKEAKPTPPLPIIDVLKIDEAEEPVVQDLVKIVNDIITVINADNASSRFSSTMNAAKAELAKVGSKIVEMKNAAGAEKLKANNEEFDKAAKELVRRLEEEMREQESKWREEFESEREKISHSYQEKLKTELEQNQKVSEQRLRNELLEQAIEMRKDFNGHVKDRVENERNGRLSKLTELSNNVNELEKLTTDWNSIVDANLQTQHLHVAVEAVRSNLDKADRPRPFVRELAALKEIALDDAVVNAAIASISPAAYQRGIPSSGQLIDRFRRVSAEVRKASLLPEDAGVASHAVSWVLSKFLFNKRGLAVGDDVESVLTRTETLLQEGNLDGAAREMNDLTGWAKTLSKDWLGDVRKVLEVQQALDVIATEARLQSLRVEG